MATPRPDGARASRSTTSKQAAPTTASATEPATATTKTTATRSPASTKAVKKTTKAVKKKASAAKAVEATKAVKRRASVATATPARTKKAATAKRSRLRSAGALLLTPGAGADRSHHTLVAVADAVAPLPTERVDFPYRIAGRRAPDKAPVAVAHLVEEAAHLVAQAGVAADRLVLGGRSYGGRMCSMAVADGLPAAGLVLLSYPLHPPGKPDKLRTEHFGAIDVPVLFVSGERDPFGSPEEFAAHVGAIAGPVTQVWLPGGHDPRNQDDVIASTVADWIRALG